MKRPLVLIASAFILGILFAYWVKTAFIVLFTSLILLTASAFFFLNKKTVFYRILFICFFLLGAGIQTRVQNLPPEHIAHFAYNRSRKVIIGGIVITDPVHKKTKTIFLMQVKWLEDLNGVQKVKGKVLVNCYGQGEFKQGDELSLEGRLCQPYPFNISSKLDYRAYLKNRDIHALLHVAKNARVNIKTGNQLSPIKNLTIFLRNAIKLKIEKNLSPQTALIIKAMILGERSQVPDFFSKALQYSGTVHVLAVSGLHTGIIACLAFAFFRIFSLGIRIRYLLVILVLLFYCLLTGGRTSVVRATIMAVIFLGSKIIGRDYEPLSALSLSALIILWFSPRQIFDVGFQLSFLSVLFILVFSSKILAIFPQNLYLKKKPKMIVKGISISLSAWLGTLGIVAYYFNLITPVSVLANLIIVPLLFLTVLSAVIFIAFSFLIPASGSVLALNCEFFTVLIFKVNSIFLKIPGAYFKINQPAIGWIIAYYLLAITLFNLKNIQKKLLPALMKKENLDFD